MKKPPTKMQIVLAYLAEHEGESLRPSEIAAGCGITTHEAAVKCRQLSQQGKLLRTHNAKTRRSTYAFPG